MGSFARWKKSSSVQYDGSYDAAHGLFVICQKDQCHKVSQDEILRPENGECDEPLANRIKLFRIKKNGEVDPNGNRIKIVGNKGEVMVNGNTRKINLDVPTIRRIDNAANQAEMKPKRPDADDKIVILPPTPKQQDPATIKNPPVWVKIDRDKPVEKKPVIIDPLAPKPEPKTEPQTPKKTVVKEPAQIRIPLHQPANQDPPPANKTTASTNRVQLRQPVSADTAKKIQKQRNPPALKTAIERKQKLP
ncbi:MAG: hypothetical protein EOO10_08610 [Chitinophagaceae bacterium]|nr:MAG: hypothetical protein EOO10_08610 [Chitinophagaceae bacterium]